MTRGARRERWRDSLAVHPDGRAFRWLWAGDTASQASTEVAAFALPLAAVTLLHATAFEMGLLTAFETLAFLVIGLPAGAWVDRLPKRGVLVVGNLVRAGALAVLPVAWWAGRLSFPVVLAAATAIGVARVFFDIAYQSYLPALVPRDRLSEGNAKLQVSGSVAQVAGPAVGGALVRALGPAAALAATAVGFAASTALTARTGHHEDRTPRAARRGLRAEIAEGLSFVVHQPLLRRIVATTGTSNFFSSASGALLVLYAVRELGLTEAQLGTALSIGALGGLLGAVASGPVTARVGEGRTIALGLLPGVVAAALVPLAAGRAPTTAAALVAASGAGVGVSVVLYNVAQVSFRQRLCPAPLLGRMNASVRFVVWGTVPLGGLAGGALASRVGTTPTLWTAVAGEALAVLPVLLSPLRHLRTLPGGEADEAPAASDDLIDR